MKPSFDPQFITNLAELRAGAEEMKMVRGERALGKVKASEIILAERTAQETTDIFLPSQIVAFTPEFADAIAEERKIQLMRACLARSLDKLQSSETVLTGKLGRLFSQSEQKLQSVVDAAGMGSTSTVISNSYTEEVTALDRLTDGLRRGDLLERIAALLSICDELGAELEEGKS